MSLKRAAGCVTGLAAFLSQTSCSPPDQHVLDFCRQSSAVSARGRGLTPADIGELIEECMSRRGYSLLKTGATCSDDLRSQNNRYCYFPDTVTGRLRVALPRF